MLAYTLYVNSRLPGFTSYLREPFEMGNWYVPLMNTETMIIDHEDETRIGNEAKLLD